MITYYRFAKSGHSHRGELFLNLLGLEYEGRDVDLGAGEHKTDAFLNINPRGQVPALTDGDVRLGDSNAILVYLASRYADESWYPTDPARRALTQSWLSFAAGEIAHGVAAARLVTVFGAKLDHEAAKTKGYASLDLVEAILRGQTWLVPGDTPTVADIAAYSYIAHAPEGDVSLAPYPSVRAWLKRTEALDGFIAMPATAIGLAA